jgi:signal transduction histidine kinase
VVLLAGLLAFLITGIVLHQERANTLKDGEARAAQLSQVLEEQTLRSVQAVDLSLRGIVNILALAPDLPLHDPAFEERLRRRRDELGLVRALFIIGADGFITQDSDNPHTPRVSLADRGYFRAHRADPSLGLQIGPPLRSRSVGVWFVSMSRRIDGPGGRFDGIVVAAVEPRYFESFYEKLHLVEGDGIAIFHRDGTLYWRTPALQTGIGRSFTQLTLFQRELPTRGAGVFRSTGRIDNGGDRIISYRALEAVPLVVVVTLAEEPLLASWRRTALGAITATTTLVALAVVVATLLTRQARQREELRERLIEAERLEALGRMAGGISHDFKNVLHVIATNLDVIRRTLHPVPAPIEAALRAAKQGTEMAARLLVFARRQPLTVEPVDVNRQLADLMPLLRQAAGPSVEIITRLAKEAWPCLTDPAELSPAVLNLVVNARDAMADGTGQVRIVTENCTLADSTGAACKLGDCVHVTVTDTGSGMPPHVLRRATEPFFSTKPRGVGTGLGLSQVYGFVRQVGGDLRIESVPGTGTSVHLFFRRAPAAEVVAAEHTDDVQSRAS